MSEGKFWEFDDLAALFGGLMGADTHTGPVGGSAGIGPWIAVFVQGIEELVHHVGMASAVSASLKEGKVICIFNGLGKFLDGLWEQVREVWHLYLFSNLVFRALGHVQDMRLVLHERPFKALLAAIDVDALAILAGDVV